MVWCDLVPCHGVQGPSPMSHEVYMSHGVYMLSHGVYMCMSAHGIHVSQEARVKG